MACTCGRPGCAHAAAAERAVAARLAAEPLLQLAHAGLPREALLAGVLGAWADELAHDPSGPGRAAETAGRPQVRGGEGGAAVGEWIAEAAADGAMHQPGPGFGAVEVRLAQPGKPPALSELTALLPGVPAHRRAGFDPRACSRADVAGCPEEDGQPSNQMMHPLERGKYSDHPCLFLLQHVALFDLIHFPVQDEFCLYPTMLMLINKVHLGIINFLHIGYMKVYSHFNSIVYSTGMLL